MKPKRKARGKEWAFLSPPTKNMIIKIKVCIKEILKNTRVVIALGKLAFDAALKVWQSLDMNATTSRIPFAHLGEMNLNEATCLIASYHPSQQNTFTGKLTEPMFDAVFMRARELID